MRSVTLRKWWSFLRPIMVALSYRTRRAEEARSERMGAVRCSIPLYSELFVQQVSTISGILISSSSASHRASISHHHIEAEEAESSFLRGES